MTHALVIINNSSISRLAWALRLLQLLVVISLSTLAPTSAFAEIIEGKIRAFSDADSFYINHLEVRLVGIDAVELNQFCPHPHQPWPCGKAATQQMESKFLNKTVICFVQAVDSYQRLLAICYQQGNNIDLASYLVTNGWAIGSNYRRENYRQQMLGAQADCRGIWEFGLPLPPEKWRKLTAEQKIPQQQPFLSQAELSGEVKLCVAK